MRTNRILKKVLKSGECILNKNGIDNAKYDSFEILSTILGCDRAYYYLHENELLTDDVCEEYMNNINIRAKHIPLQHILGYTEFWGYRFKVDTNVLVPRQDTEILVEQALRYIKEDSCVLDMCTGSGCIILSLALTKKMKCGLGVDVSAKALEIARTNQNSLGVDNVKFVESNMFNDVGTLNCNRYDVIVSNPPYIKTSDIEQLEEEVRAYDPYIALDGHEDGLYFYREITIQSQEFISEGGCLLYEIGCEQAEDVSLIMTDNGYKNIKVIKDLAGLDRVVIGTK